MTASWFALDKSGRWADLANDQHRGDYRQWVQEYLPTSFSQQIERMMASSWWAEMSPRQQQYLSQVQLHLGENLHLEPERAAMLPCSYSMSYSHCIVGSTPLESAHNRKLKFLPRKNNYKLMLALHSKTGMLQMSICKHLNIHKPAVNG